MRMEKKAAERLVNGSIDEVRGIRRKKKVIKKVLKKVTTDD